MLNGKFVLILASGCAHSSSSSSCAISRNLSNSQSETVQYWDMVPMPNQKSISPGRALVTDIMCVVLSVGTVWATHFTNIESPSKLKPTRRCSANRWTKAWELGLPVTWRTTQNAPDLLFLSHGRKLNVIQRAVDSFDLLALVRLAAFLPFGSTALRGNLAGTLDSQTNFFPS